jgi:benzodiazapine receptor
LIFTHKTYPLNNANKTNALLQLVAFLLMICLNAAANILPINGYNTGEISAMFPNYFVPAGFTFGIWSVLYLLQAWWVLFSLKIAYGKEDDLSAVALVSLLMPYFSIACLLNASWILAWHFLQVGLSLGIMVLLLLVLIALYVQLRAFTVPPEGWVSWVIPVVFVTYLAWISVATIANATALLKQMNVEGIFSDEPSWSVIMIFVALELSYFMGYLRREPAFAFVLCWAFYGIYKGQAGNDVIVGYTALTASVLSLLIGISSGFRKIKDSAIDGVL